MRVLVTGVNGFLGRAVAEELLRGGDSVCGIARGEQGFSPRIDYRRLDIADFAGVEELLAGERPDAVVHLAALVHRRDALEQDYERINAEASRRLFAACQRHGVPIAVLASTIEVYGAREGTVDEQTPVAPVTPYGRSKVAAEAAAAALPRHAILRLTPLYGPGHMDNVEKRFYLPRTRIGLRFGKGDYAFHFCQVERVAQFIRAFLEGEGAPGIYVLSDPEMLRASVYLRRQRADGAMRFALAVPRGLGRAAVAALEVMLRLTGRRNPFVSRYNFDKLFRSTRYDGSKAQSVIDGAKQRRRAQ